MTEVIATPPDICPICRWERLRLTGSLTKQAIYRCPHRGDYVHVTLGFEKSYDPVTRWQLCEDEQTALRRREDIILRDQTQKVRWVFKEVEEGKTWRIGNKKGSKLVKHMDGFRDMRYAITRMWEGEISLIELPNVFQAPAGNNVFTTQEQDGDGFTFVAESYSTETIEKEPVSSKLGKGVYVSSGEFHFQADPVADRISLAYYKQENERLRGLLKTAKVAGDTSEVEMVKSRLRELNRHQKDCYVPGGNRKMLNDGNILDRTWHATRARKSRAVAALKKHGLHQMAQHFKDYYNVRPRTFGYCPPYKPHWLLGKFAFTSNK